ncbi:hypothetical protein ES703_118514 [subsurface metagenome]
MSKIERKFKRMHKGNVNGPRAESFCEDGVFGTAVYYDGKIGLTGIPDIAISSDDLPVLDRAITQAFKRLPWNGLDDLLQIADFVIDNGLTVVEDTMKGD